MSVTSEREIIVKEWHDDKGLIHRREVGQELIRCKECKYIRIYNDDDDGTQYYYCALEDRPNRQWSVDETDFCSWGERKE